MMEDFDSKPEAVDANEANIEQINSNVADSEEYVVQEETKTYEEKKPEPVKQAKTAPVKTSSPKTVSQKIVAKPSSKPKVQAVKPARFVKKSVKNHRNGEKMKKTKSRMPWLWIIIIAILAIVLVFVLMKNKTPPVSSNQTSTEIAATVNGEPIYTADINAQYDKLTPLQKGVMSKETLLNQTIDEMLLLQESKNQNIKVTGEDIKNELDNFKKQNQLSDKQLQDLLAQQNITEEQLQKLIEKKLRIRNLLNKTVLSGISITDSQIKEYYNNNKSLFTEPAKVTVQHILIMISENVTDKMANDKIQSIAKMLNATNFCDLVKKYSDDLGSKDTCGQYTFGQGEMVPEFETASFKLETNQTTIVKTVYGYHLIKKLGSTEAKLMTLDKVHDEINQTLYDQEAQKKFDTLLKGLREKAVIVNYMFRSPEPVTMTLPVKTVTQEKTVTRNLENFSKCIASKGVVFYGVDWCESCNETKKLFGDSFKNIHYIDCADPENPQVQTEECNKANIKGYPTWIINDQTYQGDQTVEELSKLTGCTI
jgi:parvulin-like peptidyl-prolyl isomerase